MLQALRTFAQETPVLYNTVSPGDDYGLSTAANDGMGAGLLIGLLLGLALAVVTIVGMWKTFQKAGKPGWASIVPIYNLIVLMEIIGRPVWWVALYFLSVIPFVGSLAVLVVAVINMNDLAKSFGKGTGFTVLLVLLPFVAFPMLGFGDAKYGGPSAAPKADGGAAPAA